MDASYDAIIVGLGGAGLSAGVELVEKGKRVLVVEKGKDWGGASKWAAEGIFAVESQQQINAGDYTTRDQMFHHLMNYSHWRNNGRIVRKLINKSAETLDWLAAHGMKTLLVGNLQDYHFGKTGTYHMFIDKFHSFDKLVDYFISKGGQVVTETEGQEILTENGHVTGLRVKHGEQVTDVKTAVVIVADGGFIGNSKMVKQYMDQDTTDLYVAGEQKATGDGINMVHKIGGQMRGFTNFQNHNACVYPTFEATGSQGGNHSINQIYSLPLLWVNRRGERFADESVVYDSVLWGNVTAKQNGQYFALVDQKTLDDFKTKRVPMLGAYTRYFQVKKFIDSLKPEDVSPEMTVLQQLHVDAATGPLTTMDQDFQQAISDGKVVKGDSIADLAQKIDVDQTTLKQTISAYNQAVKGHYDPEFNKDARLLKYGVAEGPFYAIKVHSAVLGTIGGIVVDENMHAINMQDKVIPGVYVTGADATGMYDNSYSDVEGITCAFAWNSGRIAGEDAARFLSKD
ncbi:FAD-dependent oxidoreductase [Lactiplantibacillus paraxiangfangensis]|uniref:FAD-dependent oxidoreductase n=1 Tax=Lactiplantibacillus paraxiangfangensis TaxID=3076224 RepID=UPI0030C66F34